MHLDRIQNENNVSKEEIDNALFESTAQETFGSINTKKKKSTGKKSHFKPWFNAECFRARNVCHRSRRLYNNYKTDYYKNMLKQASNKYKKALTYNNRRFIIEKSTQLRPLKNQHPREYWKIINSHKKPSESQVSLDDIYQFFKSINENSEEHTDLNSDNADYNFDETFDTNVENEVNQPITESEILKKTLSYLKTIKHQV